LGEVTQAPYEFSWQTGAPGDYRLKAVATDDRFATNESLLVTVTVTPPNQAPNVALISPVNGSSFWLGDPIALEAQASDPDLGGHVAKVSFYDGTNLLAEVAVAPYRFNWTGAAVGPHRLIARAVDDEDAVKDSDAIAVTVNQPNKPPTIVWTVPARDTNVFAPDDVALGVSASDPDGTVAKIEFYNGTNLLRTLTSKPYSWTWTGVPIGTYDLTARAYDNLAASTTSEVRRVSVVASIRWLGWVQGQGFSFTIYGEPDRRYTIEASEDLDTWRPLRTLQSPDGISDFADREAASKPRRFYRIKAQ